MLLLCQILNTEGDEYLEPSTDDAKVTAEDFDRYYDQYSRCIYAFLNQYILDQQDKEDLLQEIFVKFWNNRRGIKTAEHARNWLYKVARTTAIDFLEKKKVKHRCLDNLEQLKDDNHYEVITMASKGLNWIYEALHNLPGQSRKLLSGGG